MQIVGVLPEDAPDPRLESAARVRALPFPVVGLIPQPSITDTGGFGFQETRDTSGHTATAVDRSYTLWRNPDDHSDPVNLAELDERTRASLDAEPPWPRPAWLIEAAQLMRYPMLRQAVRTSWNRDPSERTTLAQQLVDHANHVLRNQYREQLGQQPGPDESSGDWTITISAVREGATARLDGADVDAAEIDTDPRVYAIGFGLREDIVVTAVLPRDVLIYLDQSFTTGTGLGGAGSDAS